MHHNISIPTDPVLRPAQTNTQSLGRLKISLTNQTGYTPVPGATIRVSYTGNPDQDVYKRQSKQ